MVSNALAGIAVGYAFGMSDEQIARGIEANVPIQGRSNLIETGKYTVIDDCYNANPASVKASLDVLSCADTRTVAILGDMFELGEHSEKCTMTQAPMPQTRGSMSLYASAASLRTLHGEQRRPRRKRTSHGSRSLCFKGGIFRPGGQPSERARYHPGKSIACNGFFQDRRLAPALTGKDRYP